MDLKEVDVLGECLPYHWYYKSKINFINKVLAGKKFDVIYDVGAGSGFFSENEY